MTTTQSRNSQLEGNAAPVKERIGMAHPATFLPKIWGGFAIAALCLGGGLGSCSSTAQLPTTETTTTTTTDPAVSPSPNSSPSPSTTQTTPTSPGVNSAPGSSSQTISDRDFLTMMTAHHQQALEMSNSALTRAKRPEIKQLASSIIKDQKSEIQTMATLYKTSYGTEIPSMGMGGDMMGKDSSGMTQMPMNGMNGMKMDMNALNTAADFDKEFLRQMSFHHQMAIQMSQMTLPTTKSQQIQTLAESIVKAQTAEIGQMQNWYQSWYKSNLPNTTSN
jgi:uncharacterized protein (DUF305 family)